MATLTVPYSFVDGTAIVASEMNSNFTAVKSFAEGISSGVNIDAGSIAASKLASYPKLVVPHTYTIAGSVLVAVGQVDYINPFFVKVPASQTVKLVAARYVIASGGNATFKVQINGVDATGFTGMVAGTTDAETNPADVSLADNSKVALVITGVAGSPQNLSVTLFFEYTWVG